MIGKRYIIYKGVKGCVLAVMLALGCAEAEAQVGDYRTDLAVGFSGGYTMSTVGFTPKVPQKSLGGYTAGVTVRYTCEKYFNSICAIVGEINITQMGWKDDILDSNDKPVLIPGTETPEEYQRTLTYIQMPLLARLGWGRERRGVQAFFQLGPQLGYMLSDKSKQNFEYDKRNTADRVGIMYDAVHDTLAIDRKFDYGIAVGAGIEFSHPKVGHFMLEGRYYYGLGNIFNSTKRDYFGRSNNNSIMIKLTYLFDVIRTKNDKIK